MSKPHNVNRAFNEYGRPRQTRVEVQAKAKAALPDWMVDPGLLPRTPPPLPYRRRACE